MWFIVALGCALLTARFGVWQLSRAHTKIAYANTVAARLDMPAVPQDALAADAQSAEQQWYRQVVLSGEWVAERTVFLMNRTMDERSGFYVMTPMRLPDGSAVIVQRGWVPRDDANPMKPPAVETPRGTVTVTGRVAPWPSHWIDIGHGNGGPVRQNLELDAFKAESGLALRPITVAEAATGANAHDGMRRDWPATLGGVSVVTNYGYAVQWFAMSVAFLALYVWLQYIRPRRPPAASESDSDSDSPSDARVDDTAPR